MREHYQMVEVHLESGTGRMKVKVPYAHNMRPGCSFQLKNSDEPERWWTVQWCSAPFDSDVLKRGWNNNI